MYIDKNISKYIIFNKESIKNTLDKLVSTKTTIIFCVTEADVLEGSATIGDYLRWSSGKSKIDLDTPVSNIINKKYIFVYKNESYKKIEEYFRRDKRLHSIPIVDENHRLIAIAKREGEEVDIGGFLINDLSPCFIIAEIGVNHNGDPALAKKMIMEAKKCGADCVKFQTFKTERIVTSKSPKAAYQLKTTNPSESQFDMLKKLELPEKHYGEIIKLCRDENIVFLSTPYSIEDIDFLDNLEVQAFKVASGQAVEPAFLEHLAQKRKPILLSTGMCSLSEVDEAVRTIRESGNEKLILLQCTTNYPSAIEDANLRAMETMRNAFDAPVGYSDHTQTDTACIAAVALGACVIEKHFTIDKTLPGPDQSSSADPAEFSRLVSSIREAEVVLGSGRKEPCKIEIANAKGMRRSVVAKHAIEAGDVITINSVAFKRPATGISPKYLNQLINRKARRKIDADQMLDWADIE